MEQRLMESIHIDIKKKELNQSEIARRLKMTAARLTHYLKYEYKMKFKLFFDLINIVYEDEAEKVHQLLNDFIRVTTKRENYRECLEWSIHNGNNELFETAIEIIHDDIFERETAAVYALSMERTKNNLEASELYERIEDLKFEGVKRPQQKMKFDTVKQMENKVFLSILTLYAHLDLKEYGAIERLAKSVLKKVEGLKEGFIKDAYSIRIKELLAISLMKNGSVEEAKELAINLILEIEETTFPLVVNSLYSLLSELHALDDYNKASSYIKKALKTFKGLKFSRYKRRENMLKATYDFINIHNNVFDGLFLEDPAEKAHYFAKTNKKQEALEILNHISKNAPLSPHQLYYKALATGDLRDFKKAEKEFYRRNDLYYCQLVEKEMCEMCDKK